MDAEPERGLAPLPDGLAAGRRALHQVAFFALAPKRYAETGRLGLRHIGSGFGTPVFGSDEQVRVEEDRIVYQRGDEVEIAPITTLGDACAFLGIPFREVWFDGFDDSLPSVGADAALYVDPAVAAYLAGWRRFARGVLDEVRPSGADAGDVTEVQLWPEHFDQAFEMGSAGSGRRASYGASPGDDDHPEPYLYVAPWDRRERRDPHWNDPFHLGASLSYQELLEVEDPGRLGSDFLAEGHRLLSE